MCKYELYIYSRWLYFSSIIDAKNIYNLKTINLKIYCSLFNIVVISCIVFSLVVNGLFNCTTLCSRRHEKIVWLPISAIRTTHDC